MKLNENDHFLYFDFIFPLTKEALNSFHFNSIKFSFHLFSLLKTTQHLMKARNKA